MHAEDADDVALFTTIPVEFIPPTDGPGAETRGSVLTAVPMD